MDEGLARLRHSQDCPRSHLPPNYDRSGEVLLLGACTCERDEIVSRALEEIGQLRRSLGHARAFLQMIATDAKADGILRQMARDGLRESSFRDEPKGTD